MTNETSKFVKPRCKLVGQDGNVFNLIGLASRALKKAGCSDKAKEMSQKIFSQAKSYEEALNMIGDYVKIE